MEKIKSLNTITSLDNENNLKIEKTSNYEGDWTLLLKDRLLSPEIRKQQLEKTKVWATLDINKLTGGLKDFDELFLNAFIIKLKKYKQSEKIKAYDGFIEFIFSNTEYIKKEESEDNSSNKAVSRAGMGEPGTLYKDEMFFKNGDPFSDRQKNIIEAHEKGHSVRTYVGEQKEEIESCIDKSKIPEEGREYLSKAEEIIERMAQLKNYFGFKGGEIFTKEHLDYARVHYVEDVKLNGGMIQLFNAITKETENKFLEVVNSYGV